MYFLALPAVRFGLPVKQTRTYFQAMAFASVLTLAVTGILYAEEIPQSWMPDAIVLPDDAEVTMDREVGSSIRMFSFKTKSDVDALFENWPSELEKSGYDIRPQNLEIGTNMIEFSGHGILNAKISTGAATGDNWVTVVFDATLE